jgi:hypothetical protein
MAPITATLVINCLSVVERASGRVERAVWTITIKCATLAPSSLLAAVAEQRAG